MERFIMNLLRKRGPMSSLDIIEKLADAGFWFPRWRAYGCLAALEDNHVVKRSALTQKKHFLGRVYELERHIYAVA